MKFHYVIAAIFLGTSITASIPTQTSASTISENVSVNSLQQIAQETTVFISNGKNNGSGFFIAKRGNSYYVLTSAHVIKDGTYQITTPDRRRYQASIVMRKLPNLDLAILEFQSDQNYRIAKLADYQLSVTSPFGAVGNIYISGWENVQGNNQPVFSCGTLFPSELTSIIQKASNDDSYELAYTNFTEAGLSGSPIFDIQARVIGIHGQVEGEDFQIDKLKLGLSLGIPIKKFLQLFNQNSQFPLVIDREPPNNSVRQSWSGSDPCKSNVISRPKDDADSIDWANYANSMFRLGKVNDALFAYDEAIKRNERLELYQFWYGRGLMLIFSERPNEALKNFDQAIKIWNEINPSDPEHKQNLDSAKSLLLKFKGLLLSRSGRYQEALFAYDEVLKLKPNSYQVWLLKGNVLRDLNRNKDAITAYKNGSSGFEGINV